MEKVPVLPIAIGFLTFVNTKSSITFPEVISLPPLRVIVTFLLFIWTSKIPSTSPPVEYALILADTSLSPAGNADDHEALTCQCETRET